MPPNLSDPRLQTALSRVNYYRQKAGVAPCTLNSALVSAAQAHADYFRQNAPLANPHGEEAGKPGFTGADWSARAGAAGYVKPDSTNENVTYIADPVAAIDAFMATINHRATILDPTYSDIGFGLATTPDGKTPIFVIDFGMPVWKDTFDPAWVIWPPDGSTSFPLQSSREGPDPFAAYPAQFPIGNPITVQYRGGDISYDGTKFSLTDAHGQPVPLYRLPKLTMWATRQSAGFASQTPLQPGMTYTATIGYGLPGHSPQLRTWRFSTGPALRDASPIFDGANLAQADPNVRNLWQAADGPVAAHAVSRTWIYGPKAFDIRLEPYQETPGGQRQVFYFDKTRMEITNPAGDRTSQWFVSTGRLVYELISGQVQLGNNTFQSRPAATVPVAGDPPAVNPTAPTYASFELVASLNNDRRVSSRIGQPVLESINRAGQVTPLTSSPAPASYRYYDTTLGHNVPDVLLNWMNALPYPWLFVVGLPLSEPYWSQVKLAGKDTDVLIQVFERRTLTYTPTNPAAWQVELGNVGQHYHLWRYS